MQRRLHVRARPRPTASTGGDAPPVARALRRREHRLLRRPEPVHPEERPSGSRAVEPARRDQRAAVAERARSRWCWPTTRCRATPGTYGGDRRQRPTGPPTADKQFESSTASVPGAGQRRARGRTRRTSSRSGRTTATAPMNVKVEWDDRPTTSTCTSTGWRRTARQTQVDSSTGRARRRPTSR